ncbi:MAG: helix-turn-helix transcriptional regulator [Phycisphaerales bacterium JB043]
MRYSRIHRLLRILLLTQSSEGWTPAKLAEECATSVRNIYRDIKELRGAGVPIAFHSDAGGYAIDSAFFLPPTNLDEHETLALSLLCRHVVDSNAIPCLTPARRAFSKIHSQLPEHVRQHVTQAHDRFSIRLPPTESHDGIHDVFTRVQASIASCRALLCQYDGVCQRSGRHPSEPFEFHPYALMFAGRAWHAIGHHANWRRVIDLRLSRFERLEPTDGSFTIPDEFSPDAYFGNAWEIRCGRTTHRVRIEIDTRALHDVLDIQWHHTQATIEQDDSTAILSFTVDGLDEIGSWVLSLGTHCRVLEPLELRERVLDTAASILRDHKVLA